MDKTAIERYKTLLDRKEELSKGKIQLETKIKTLKDTREEIIKDMFELDMTPETIEDEIEKISIDLVNKVQVIEDAISSAG